MYAQKYQYVIYIYMCVCVSLNKFPLNLVFDIYTEDVGNICI